MRTCSAGAHTPITLPSRHSCASCRAPDRDQACGNTMALLWMLPLPVAMSRIASCTCPLPAFVMRSRLWNGIDLLNKGETNEREEGGTLV